MLPQPARVLASSVALATLVACGGHGRVAESAPVNPEATVRAFLNAVKANSIVAMRDLWGTDQPNSVDPSNSLQRIVRVRLTRKGCQPVVPFTTVQWKKGWLVKNIDLSAAGNPARACGEQAAPGT